MTVLSSKKSAAPGNTEPQRTAPTTLPSAIPLLALGFPIQPTKIPHLNPLSLATALATTPKLPTIPPNTRTLLTATCNKNLTTIHGSDTVLVSMRGGITERFDDIDAARNFFLSTSRRMISEPESVRKRQRFSETDAAFFFGEGG